MEREADTISMIEIKTTAEFYRWYKGLESTTHNRVMVRMRRLSEGNAGDCKNIGGGLCELRCRFAGGVRIYYTWKGESIVLLLAGGNKSTQKRDIKEAREILAREAAND